MELNQIAELAALVSANSTHLIESPTQVPDQPLNDYWRCSQQRLQNWTHHLNEYAFPVQHDTGQSSLKSWQACERILEEIFVSELLTRVWAAVLTAADRRRNISHAEPIVRSVFVGHLEARHQAMSQLANGPDVSLEELSRVDRLRRRVERWTDLLLGHLVIPYDVGEFAFEERRAIDFGKDQLDEENVLSPIQTWDFILTGMRLAFAQNGPTAHSLDEVHSCIVRSILACFPADAFQSDGPFKSILTTRIGRSGMHPERSPVISSTSSPTSTETPPSMSSQLPSSGVSFANLSKRYKSGKKP